MKKALILVDIQSDFADKGGALYVPEGEEVVSIANRLIISDKFDLIVCTQDNHSILHKSFASNHENKKPGDVINLNGVKQILWIDHCVSGTRGADFHKNLLVGKVNLILRKGGNIEVDSYSGFFDNAKYSTGLAEYLRANGINLVYICGIALDYCVKYTAIDARNQGFDTHLIEDGCRAVNINPDDGKKAIEEMKAAGIIIEKSGDELVKLWKTE